MPRENKTKYIILGLLNHEDQTGYDIRQSIEYGIGTFWSDLSYGQIYPTLRKLEEAGLVTKRVDTEETRRIRNVYSITKKGKQELTRWLEKDAEPELYKIDSLLKIYFGAAADLDTNMDHIEGVRKRSQAFLERLQGFEANIRKFLDESPDHPYILLTMLFGQHVMQAQLDWADEATKFLKSQNKKSKPL